MKTAAVALVLVLAAATGAALGSGALRASSHQRLESHRHTGKRHPTGTAPDAVGPRDEGAGSARTGSAGAGSERAGSVGADAAGASQAGAGAGAQGARASASSREGLALGKPPFDLSWAGPTEALSVSFSKPPLAGLVFNLDSGRVLWARNATQALPIASLAKMMTALLVVHSLPEGAQVRISRRAVNASGSKVGLLPLGKRVPVGALLYGLLLPSGNDAATALAEAAAGSVRAFVRRMNVEAARLGMGCTLYTSPDGLDNGNSSCTTDLAELAIVDLAQPRIASVVRSASAVVPFPIKGGKLYLYNNNPLLRYGYPGATGLKTGETEAAGLCLVGTAERGGVRLGVVLLHSPELGRQAERLLNAAFEDVYRQAPIAAPPVPKGR
jgi:serine-type D-Ala-D-Ala carboxypeptidase (penicillin-binding protein 5/6)